MLGVRAGNVFYMCVLISKLYCTVSHTSRSQQSAVLKELDVKRTQLVWESNKLTEAESKLYHSEQQNARRKEELTKIRIRLQESTEKMNQSEWSCLYMYMSGNITTPPLYCSPPGSLMYLKQDF